MNIDGTVAHTPEYLAVAAAHQAEHIHALHRARRSAPLNPDGTVAPTPEVAAATAAHYAALNGAALRTVGVPVHAYGAAY
ncbi:hypothetical protein, partial [Acinetobacter pittii]|uniref:hypothetical protein n=1 Tax=Acinetobacter pittii TaxID=48296 RepID=UPI00168D54FA